MDVVSDSTELEVDFKEPGFSIGFLTALADSELTQCEDELRRVGWVEDQSTSRRLRDAGIKQWTKLIDGINVTAFSMAINGMGNSISTLETFNFLYRAKPSLVLLCGIAGSLYENDIHKCDVVVGSSVRWRIRNRIREIEGKFDYRTKDIPLSNSVLDSDFARVLHNHLIKEFPKKERGEDQFDNWNVHFDEIYTWEYVLNSQSVTREINQQFPNSRCVEMEAGGFLAAVDKYSKIVRPKKPVFPLVVRGISDYTIRKDKVSRVRKDASRNAAQVAIALAEWLSSEDGFAMISKAQIA